ncbi:MAG: hypothetical protein VKK04_24680 [Synechococcales bacterium]|nr:hypothetical protein [Synechococcales bacterium]
MIIQNIQKALPRLLRVAIATLLATGMALLGSYAFEASAYAAAPQQTHENDYYSDIFSGRLRTADELDSNRLAAIEDCLPEELTIENKNTGDRVARALGEWNNEQLERAFNLKDDPALNQAEKEFERCLNRKGIHLESPVQ